MKPAIATSTRVETAFVLLGERTDSIWLAKMSWRSRGTETSVLFNGERVLAREEAKGDVIGFYHTHPEGFTNPSGRDDKTMFAWSFCFGKPLLAVIATSAGLRAWIYNANDESRQAVSSIVPFKGSWLVAVESINA